LTSRSKSRSVEAGARIRYAGCAHLARQMLGLLVDNA
jgi:hypothetical protein